MLNFLEKTPTYLLYLISSVTVLEKCDDIHFWKTEHLLINWLQNWLVGFNSDETIDLLTKSATTPQTIWVRSRRCDCLVTWLCYHLIAKPGNKTATSLWPDPYHWPTFCSSFQTWSINIQCSCLIKDSLPHAHILWYWPVIIPGSGKALFEPWG